jgi:phage shock protein A
MASLLDKVATLIKANLHYLVDQALKQNSLAVIDQYIREVEDNLDKLEDAAATVGGQVKTLKRKFDEFQAKAEELDRNIDILLQEGREELAVAAQSKLNSTQRLADNYREQHERQKAEYEKLLDAKLKLEAKLTEIRQERVELQAKLELAKSKELTHKTVEGVAGVTTADEGLASMREEVQKRLDKAAAQGEIDASRLDNQMADVLEEHTISVQLEERRRRLGLGSES